MPDVRHPVWLVPLPPAQIAPALGVVVTPDDITLALRYYRLKRQRTLPELAAAVGCSKSYLRQAEVGEGDCSVYTLGRLAHAVAVSPWTLVQYGGWPVPCCPCRAQHPGWGRP